MTEATERIPSRQLGPLEVGAIGVGCMAMTGVYGPFDESEAERVIALALDRGATMIDTAEVYGPHTNEELVGRTIAGRRDEVVISSKCGLTEREPGSYDFIPNADPAYIREACEGSLRRLGVETIDLYYQHRLDPAVPVEETVGVYAELIAEGKIRAVGLCEVDIETLERAMLVHPIASVQAELSLWTREQLETIVRWCRARHVGFVPYAPLGRGFLTGKYRTSEFAEGDFRAGNPRFQDEALKQNLRLVDRVEEIAQRHGGTPGQVALAWVLAQGEHVVPIPGMEKVAYLQENLGGATLQLTDEDLAELDALPPAAGSRY
jgi:aryl-alcohol dehydrogenase-like predicted oxidoreductase